MRYLGIDWGQKNIGLAFSDEGGKLALPYEVWNFKDWDDFDKKIRKLIEQEKVGKIIMGLPLSLNQTETQQTQEVKKAAGIIVKITGLEVIFENEVFTSKIAEIHSSKKLDASAAALILQGFLDKKVQER